MRACVVPPHHHEPLSVAVAESVEGEEWTRPDGTRSRSADRPDWATLNPQRAHTQRACRTHRTPHNTHITMHACTCVRACAWARARREAQLTSLVGHACVRVVYRHTSNRLPCPAWMAGAARRAPIVLWTDEDDSSLARPPPSAALSHAPARPLPPCGGRSWSACGAWMAHGEG